MSHSDGVYQPPWFALIALVIGAVVQIQIVFMIDEPMVKLGAASVLLFAAFGYQQSFLSAGQSESAEEVETESDDDSSTPK